MSTKNLLLLHGALGSKGQLQRLAELLSQEYTVHVINFDGHGDSHSDSAFSINHFTKNVFDFLTKNKISSTHLFGYSMGGYVALNFAIQHPDLVKKITTLATKFDWTKEAAEQEVKMLNPNIIEVKVPKFASHLQAVHHPNDWKEVLKKTANMMLDLGTHAALPLDAFNKIKHQVLITVGDQDHMVSMAESQAVVDQLDNGTLSVLAGFKHPIEKNSPEELASVISTFLS